MYSSLMGCPSNQHNPDNTQPPKTLQRGLPLCCTMLAQRCYVLAFGPLDLGRYLAGDLRIFSAQKQISLNVSSIGVAQSSARGISTRGLIQYSRFENHLVVTASSNV